jgi:hypothetical protein
MWFDFATDDLSRPVVEELPQLGSWLSGDKKQRQQEMIPVGEIREKDDRAHASPAAAGI